MIFTYDVKERVKNMNQNGFSIPNQSTAPPYQNFTTTPNYNPAGDVNYAENILELNVGKRANFYMSYSDSLEWRDKVFSGFIEAAGRDYAVIRDQENHYFVLWTVYLNYVEFLEPIMYSRR